MKTCGLFFLFFSAAFASQAQWASSGSNVYLTTGTSLVGIGTSTPSAKLDVLGASNFAGRLTQTASNPNDNSATFVNSAPSGYGLYSKGGFGTHYAMHVENQAGTSLLFVGGDGKTGIGTNDPKNTLTVRGVINSELNGDYYGAWFGGESRTDKPSINVGVWWNNKGSMYWNSNRLHFRTQVNSTSAYENNLVLDAGRVGVGTATPVVELDVVGGINLQSNNNVTWGGAHGAGVPTIAAATNNGFYFYPAGTTSGITMRMDAAGNVGIGTTSPDAKLAVKGTIHTQEVKVDLSVPGPDYVFEENYNLPSLESIKTYVDQNKHLPELPSAKEMETNGLNLGEMNMLLLKKIEELTLYVIEQQQKMEVMHREIQDLKNNK